MYHIIFALEVLPSSTLYVTYYYVTILGFEFDLLSIGIYHNLMFYAWAYSRKS